MRMVGGRAAVPGRVVLRVPPLHARPPDDGQEQPDQAALAVLRPRRCPVTKKLLLTGNRGSYRNSLGTGSQTQKVAVVLEIVNAQSAGLGIPLPKGIVRVYKKDKSGAEQFVGEDSIDHTPKDETLRLQVGDAFDVVAERSQTDFKAVSPRQNESAWTIVLAQPEGRERRRHRARADGRRLDSRELEPPGKKVDQQTLEFEVPVAKGRRRS